MNFNQWKSHAAKKSVGRVTYCCGDETTLIELVLQDIISILEVPATDLIEVDAKDDFWEIASSYPLDESINRVTVIRNAETIQNWNKLYDWLSESKNNLSNYIVFISYKSDGPAIYEKGKRVKYYEHIDTIRTKGKFIKCSTPNEEDLISWGETFGLTKNSAKFLAERTAGDVRNFYNVLRKLPAWDGSPSPKALELLTEQNSAESFVDALILKDKNSAYRALINLEDRSQIFAKLSARLDMLHEIGKYVRKRMYAGDIAAQTGINVFLIKKFASSTKHYDFNKIKYCRKVIATTDAAQRNGVKEGLWEMMVALW